MTNYERKRLLEAYTDYVEKRLSGISGLIVILVGFSLATLSVTKISPGFNLFVMGCVLFFSCVFCCGSLAIEKIVLCGEL